MTASWQRARSQPQTRPGENFVAPQLDARVKDPVLKDVLVARDAQVGTQDVVRATKSCDA